MNKIVLQSAIYGKMKKAQFKIQQMSFMIVAVLLFFILVGLFWIAIQSRTLTEVAGQAEKEQAIILSEFLSGSAEFSCSRELGSYCVDTDKMMVLKDIDYGDFWPVTYIKIVKLDGNPEKECDIGNYPDCNIINIYGREEEGGEIGSFVALCRHERIDNYPIKICELGKISIGTG